MRVFGFWLGFFSGGCGKLDWWFLSTFEWVLLNRCLNWWFRYVLNFTWLNHIVRQLIGARFTHTSTLLVRLLGWLLLQVSICDWRLVTVMNPYRIKIHRIYLFFALPYRCCLVPIPTHIRSIHVFTPVRLLVLWYARSTFRRYDRHRTTLSRKVSSHVIRVQLFALFLFRNFGWALLDHHALDRLTFRAFLVYTTVRFYGWLHKLFTFVRCCHVFLCFLTSHEVLYIRCTQVYRLVSEEGAQLWLGDVKHNGLLAQPSIWKLLENLAVQVAWNGLLLLFQLINFIVAPLDLILQITYLLILQHLIWLRQHLCHIDILRHYLLRPNIGIVQDLLLHHLVLSLKFLDLVLEVLAHYVGIALRSLRWMVTVICRVGILTDSTLRQHIL